MIGFIRKATNSNVFSFATRSRQRAQLGRPLAEQVNAAEAVSNHIFVTAPRARGGSRVERVVSTLTTLRGAGSANSQQ